MQTLASKNRTVSLDLSTSNLDIYTVPNNYEAEVTSIIVSNASSAPRTFSLDWYENSTGTYFTVAELTPIEANSIIQLTDGFWLSRLDKFRGLASATSSITVTIQVREYFIPQQKT